AIHRAAPAVEATKVGNGRFQLELRNGRFTLTAVTAALAGCQQEVSTYVPQLAKFVGGRFQTNVVPDVRAEYVRLANRAPNNGNSLRADDPDLQHLISFTELPSSPGGAYNTRLEAGTVLDRGACFANETHERVHKMLEEDRVRAGAPRYSGALHEMLAYEISV